MRLEKRFITRKTIIESSGDYEIIESYPDDKCMPSYLVRSVYKGDVFHALFAIDKEKRNVRIITAYYTDPRHWNNSFKKRRK